MTRLNQLHANDYPSQTKINDEFVQLIGYLQAVERGGKTLTELIALLADGSGAVRSDFIEFQVGATHLQWRTSGGNWNDLISLTSITGPAGPSGAGTGDMVRATYDPDNDGRIAMAQLNIANGDLSIAKTSGLQTALDTKLSVTVSATAPSSPTYPSPMSGWWDISTPTAPVLRIWDGVSQWRSISSSTTSTSSSTSDYPLLLAGEALLNRDAVFLAGADSYGSDVATGGTPLSSAGTAANLTDGNDSTSCDTASTSGWVGYNFGTGVTKTIGLVELLLGPSSGSYTYQFTFETSPDGTTWTAVQTQSAQSTYTTSAKTFIRISSPVAAQYFRIRSTYGLGSNFSVRTMKLYERSTERGRIYKIDDDSSPVRKSRDLFVTTDAVSSGNRVRCFAPGSYIENMTGLAASTVFFTSATPGVLSSSANSKATRMGEAKDATTLNFLPTVSRAGVGEVIMFSGDIADLLPWQLLCDGSILSRDLYPELFARIGTNFGSGDGVTTFALPDLRDRFLVGAKQDNSGIPNTNLTGSLTQSGGSRTASVTTGGGGSNLSGATSALQVTLDPPYFAMAFAMTAF